MQHVWAHGRPTRVAQLLGQITHARSQPSCSTPHRASSTRMRGGAGPDPRAHRRSAAPLRRCCPLSSSTWTPCPQPTCTRRATCTGTSSRTRWCGVPQPRGGEGAPTPPAALPVALQLQRAARPLNVQERDDRCMRKGLGRWGRQRRTLIPVSRRAGHGHGLHHHGLHGRLPQVLEEAAGAPFGCWPPVSPSLLPHGPHGAGGRRPA